MTCRPCLDTYIHTYKQTINQYKQIGIIHKSIETYSYTYTWLQMVRPPQPTHRGGAGTLCVHVVSLCADTKTMTCRPCWDTHILTYQQTDRQTHRHTYINQYKHIVIPIHGCICVTYPPFGGGGGGEPGGAGSYIQNFLCMAFLGFPLRPMPQKSKASYFNSQGVIILVTLDQAPSRRLPGKARGTRRPNAPKNASDSAETYTKKKSSNFQSTVCWRSTFSRDSGIFHPPKRAFKGSLFLYIYSLVFRLRRFRLH